MNDRTETALLSPGQTGQTCACGHNHGDSHGQPEETSCSCGHGEAHHCEHGRHENISTCACGHHENTQSSCSCGHNHENTQGPACSCGHSHEISFDTDCDCGHEHGTAQNGRRWDVVTIIAAVAAIALSFLPMPGLVSTALVAGGILLAGYPLFLAGVKNIFRLKLDETALLLIAVIASAFLGEWVEGAMVTVLFRLGNMLEDMAISRSKKSISSLTKIRPQTANLLVEGSFVPYSAAEIAAGSDILVKPGERVPIDAEITKGESFVDTSVITGESLPRQVSVGDILLSGTLNQDGALYCRTVNTFSDSAASRIIKLVEESAAKKGTTEKMITKFSRVYTPFIIVAAVLLTFLPPVLGFGSISLWLGRALVFLVASCPCALVISVPLAFFAGVGAGSRVGVLVKGSKALENLAKARYAVFDKTGTLTTGQLAVTDIVPLTDELTKEELLALCAAGERFSNHPMAQAVLNAYGTGPVAEVTDLTEHPGMGVSYKAGQDEYLCGGKRLLAKFGVAADDLPHGNIYLVINGVVQGYLLLADAPRPDAAETLALLRTLGVEKTIILTGDNAKTAEAIRQQCGADEVHADLLPEDKVTNLETIKQNGCTVFVGDGMNDAPVLAMADVGVAMGLGTDAAIEAADVVLVSDKLGDLVKAVRLGRRTVATARFNITFALAVKAAVLILGACGLAQMWMAVFADVGVAILAVLNSTRVLQKKD